MGELELGFACRLFLSTVLQELEGYIESSMDVRTHTPSGGEAAAEDCGRRVRHQKPLRGGPGGARPGELSRPPLLLVDSAAACVG